MTQPTVLTPADRVLIESRLRASTPTLERARAERRQRQGKVLVVTGWIAAVVGVVLYCVASFAGEASADLAAILIHGAVPGARAALVIVGGGTLLWIAGSVMLTNAVLDAAELEPRRRDDAAPPAEGP